MRRCGQPKILSRLWQIMPNWAMYAQDQVNDTIKAMKDASGTAYLMVWEVQGPVNDSLATTRVAGYSLGECMPFQKIS